MSAPKPGQCLAGASLSRHAVRGLPGQRRSDRTGARGRRRQHPLGATIRARGRGHRGAGPGPTPIWASCSCWRRWRGRRLAQGGTCANGWPACWRRPPWPTRQRPTPPSGARGPGGLGAAAAEDVSDTAHRDAAGGDGARGRARRRSRGSTPPTSRSPSRWACRPCPGQPAGGAGVDRRGGGGLSRRCSPSTPDTHVARKLGLAEAERHLGAGARGPRPPAAPGGRGRKALAALDAELRDPRNRRNPGTTADLTCAALFVVILEGGWDR